MRVGFIRSLLLESTKTLSLSVILGQECPALFPTLFFPKMTTMVINRRKDFFGVVNLTHNTSGNVIVILFKYLICAKFKRIKQKWALKIHLNVNKCVTTRFLSRTLNENNEDDGVSNDSFFYR